MMLNPFIIVKTLIGFWYILGKKSTLENSPKLFYSFYSEWYKFGLTFKDPIIQSSQVFKSVR